MSCGAPGMDPRYGGEPGLKWPGSGVESGKFSQVPGLRYEKAYSGIEKFGDKPKNTEDTDRVRKQRDILLIICKKKKKQTLNNHWYYKPYDDIDMGRDRKSED